MMGQQPRTESLFYYFRLEDQIPEDHLLRLLDHHVDFSFVRKRLKSMGCCKCRLYMECRYQKQRTRGEQRHCP